MTDFIYYPPGHGGHLGGGLGEALRGLGIDICGRQTVGKFLALTLTEQMGFDGRWSKWPNLHESYREPN